MQREYFIRLVLKNGSEMESFASFNLGTNRVEANGIFSKLHGKPVGEGGNVLYVEFLEIWNNLPVSLDMISCSLDELGENCKIITRELFKQKSLSLTTK